MFKGKIGSICKTYSASNELNNINPTFMWSKVKLRSKSAQKANSVTN